MRRLLALAFVPLLLSGCIPGALPVGNATQYICADGAQIAALYARLHDLEPTPVIALNHAVALAESGQLAQALAQVQALGPQLDGYQPFHATRADFLARSGDNTAARPEYLRAIALAGSKADRSFLHSRLTALD